MMKLSTRDLEQITYAVSRGATLPRALQMAGLDLSERQLRRLWVRQPTVRMAIEAARAKYQRRRRSGKADLVTGLVRNFQQVGLDLSAPILAAGQGLDLASLAAGLDAWAAEVLARVDHGIDVNLPDQPDDAWIDQLLAQQPTPPPDWNW